MCVGVRLARSTRDLLNTLATISERGASFKSLGDGWADTTTAHGKLMRACGVRVSLDPNAKEKVKEWIRARGYRVQDFSAKQLAIMAEAYLVDHREELMPQAKVWAEEFLTKRR